MGINYNLMKYFTLEKAKLDDDIDVIDVDEPIIATSHGEQIHEEQLSLSDNPESKLITGSIIGKYKF